MASVLLVAHAPLASSLLAVAQHVYPDCAGRLSAVDVPASMTADAAAEQIRATIERMGAAEVLILTDVFGATPCNAALAASDGQRSRVVAGVNVPMLWRALCYSQVSLDELVERAVAGATQGVMQVSAPRRQNQPNSPASHDHIANQHQQ